MSEVGPERDDARGASSRGTRSSRGSPSQGDGGGQSNETRGAAARLRVIDGYDAQAAALNADQSPAALRQSVDPTISEPGVGPRAAKLGDDIRAFERELSDHVQKHAAWLSRNWTRYLTQTGGNASIALSESEFRGLVACPSNTPNLQTRVLDKAGSGAIGAGVKAGGAWAAQAIGGASFALGAAIVGGALGMLAGLVWSHFVSGALAKKASDKASHKLLGGVGEQIIERATLFDGQAATVIGDKRLVIDNAVLATQGARTHAALDAVERWIANERAAFGSPKPEDDQGLCDQMLVMWRLQHSKASDEASDRVNGTSYEEAAGRDENKKGASARTLASENRWLFAHQLRLGMLENGLLDHAQVRALEAQAKAIFSRGGDASEVVAQTDKCVLEVRQVDDPGAFAEAATKSVTVFPDAGGTTPDYRGPARRGNVVASLTLDVDEDKDCAILRALHIDARCLGADLKAHREGISTLRSEGGFDRATWTWKP